MVSQYLGGAAQRYVYDPAAGAYYDTVTGQHVMTLAGQAGDVTFDGAPSAGTAEAYPELSTISDTGLTGGPSTMQDPVSTIQPVPLSAIDSGQVQPRAHPGDPPPSYLVPPDYRSGPYGQLSDTTFTGDATTQQMPAPPALFPESGWVDPSAGAPVSDASGGGSGSSGARYGGGYDSGSGGGYRSSGRSSYRSGYGGSSGSSSSRDYGSSDPMSNLPAYADGSRHPAQTGSGLVPGGQFNDGSSGAGYRPGGFGGHDYAVWGSYRGRPAANFATQFGYEDKPPSLARQLRWGIMDRVNQAAMGAMSGGMGGTMGATPATAGVPAQQSGMGGTGPTGMRGMRGWARQQGFTPAGLQDIAYNPQWLYPHILPGLKPGTPFFNQIDDQLSPNLSSLWSGSAGARRNTGSGLDHYANWVNRVVKGYATPGGNVFNANRLIKGLTLPQRGSTQWQALQGQTFGEQAYNLTNQIGAVTSAAMNPMAASATMAYLDTLLNRAGSRNLTRGPKRQVRAVGVVARHLFR